MALKIPFFISRVNPSSGCFFCLHSIHQSTAADENISPSMNGHDIIIVTNLDKSLEFLVLSSTLGHVIYKLQRRCLRSTTAQLFQESRLFFAKGRNDQKHFCARITFYTFLFLPK